MVGLYYNHYTALDQLDTLIDSFYDFSPDWRRGSYRIGTIDNLLWKLHEHLTDENGHNV